MNRPAPDAPVTTTVSALSDRRLVQQLKELTAVEHQLEVVVIDHLRELERRRLYLSWGFSSLFDYVTRELGYSEAAAWRRIKAMRLCADVEGARERMRDGSLTLNSAALLQNAFDRQERKRTQSGGGRSARGGVRPAATPNGSALDADAPPREPSAPAQAEERAEETHAAPVLDSSARQALVEEAAGKSTRQVENLLAGVDPELAIPADRIRPLGAGRWELKAVIDDDCRRGMEQLKGLLSHVDPHMTLGQIVGGGAGSGRTPRPSPPAARPALRKPRRVLRRRRNFGAEGRIRTGRYGGMSERRAGGQCGGNFGAEGRNRAGRRIGATERHAGGLRARPHSGSDPVRGGGATFGAEGGIPPATASRDSAVPGTEPRHPGGNPATGLEARSGLLQLRGPVQRAPLRFPSPDSDRSHPSVRARRQRRTRQSPSAVRRPPPPPPCGPGRRTRQRAGVTTSTATPTP